MTLTQPTATADVTPRALTITGIAAATKVYDGTTTATIDTTAATLNGVLLVDAGNVALVTSGARGAFADKNVGTGKIVTITGLTLSGGAAGNYTVIPPTTTADILPSSGPTIVNPLLIGNEFKVSVSTALGANYVLEFKNSFTDTVWTVAQTRPGTGSAITLFDSTATNSVRFYRVRVE